MSDVILVSIISSVSVLLSAFLTQLITNRKELKFKQFDFNNTIKREIINDFIDCSLNSYDTYEHKIMFYKSLNKLVPFLDNKTSKIVGKIKYLFESGSDTKVINTELLKLSMALANQRIKIK